MNGRRPNTIRISIADDDRARIPFAMIGALILLSSVGTIGVLESRTPPQPNVDPSIALDRTGVTAEAALRVATRDALEAAGRAPVTEATDETTLGRAIAGDGDGDDGTFERYVALLVYVHALETMPTAGQAIRDDVETAVSIPTIDESEPEATLDGRIDLTIGGDGSPLDTGKVEVTLHGVQMEVVRDGVRVGHRTETISVTVATPLFELHERTVEYDQRLDRGFFEEDTVTGYEGMGRYMAARLYPMAYFKAGFDRARAHEEDDQAFADVLPNGHIEVMSNHAAFSIQEAVYGTTDRHSDRVMRGPWACLATDVVHDLSKDVEVNVTVGEGEGEGADGSDGGDGGGDSGDGGDGGGDSGDGGDGGGDSGDGGDGGDTSKSNEENGSANPDPEEMGDAVNMSIAPFEGVEDIRDVVCDAGVQERVFGDQTGALPPAPTVRDIATDSFGSLEMMNETESVPIDPFVELGYYDTKGVTNLHETLERGMEHVDERYRTDPDDSVIPDELAGDIGDAIADVYEVDVELESTSSRSGSLPRASHPGGNYSLYDSSTAVTDIGSVSVDRTLHERGEATDRTIQELTFDVDIVVRNERRWIKSTVNYTGPLTTRTSAETILSYEVGVDIDGSYGNRGSTVDGPIARDFEQGGPAPGNGSGSHASTANATGFEAAVNFEPVLDRSAEDLLAVDSVSTMEGDIASELSSLVGSSPPASDTVEDLIVDRHRRVYNAEAWEDGDALEEWLEAELNATRAYVESNVDPLSVHRMELIQGEPPYDALVDDLDESFVYDDPSAVEYGSVPERARAEVRYILLENTERWIYDLQAYHGDTVREFEGRFDEEVSGADGVLEQTTDFAHGILSGEVSEETGDFAGSPLLNDSSVTVSASPTYLPIETVNRSVEPAVRPPAAPPLTVADSEHAGLATRYDNRLDWPGIGIVSFSPKFWWLQANTWAVEVEGEYARFEASANSGDPTSTTATRYVREDRPVTVSVNTGTTYVGNVEPVTLSSSTEVVVVMPGLTPMARGLPPGVGDAGDEGDYRTECSPTWDHVGPAFESNDDPGDRGVVDACENFDSD